MKKFDKRNPNSTSIIYSSKFIKAFTSGIKKLYFSVAARLKKSLIF